MSYGLILTDLNFQGIGNDGLVVPYGKVYITNYTTGLLETTYQDAALITTNPNPVILSAVGKAKIFLKYGQYNITLKDQFDADIWTLNNIVSSILDNQSVVDASMQTAVSASQASASASQASASASQASQFSNASLASAIQAQNSANSAIATALIVNAYGNLQWAGFTVPNSELIVTYFDSNLSVPSLVNGDFILTY